MSARGTNLKTSAPQRFRQLSGAQEKRSGPSVPCLPLALFARSLLGR